jgi:hypothetical protein
MNSGSILVGAISATGLFVETGQHHFSTDDARLLFSA